MSNINVLVVGGGIAGMVAFAIRLCVSLGWEVDLVEVDPLWQVYDTGMIVTGPHPSWLSSGSMCWKRVCGKGFRKPSRA